MLAGILALCFGLFVFCEWGKLTTWDDWSYMIALTLALGVGIFVHALIYDEDWMSIGWIGTGGLVLCALLNWWFGAECLPIVTVLTLTLTFIAVTSAYLTFSNGEVGVGWWNVVLSVLNAALLIYSMIEHSHASSWTLWQCLISVLLSLVLAVMTHVIITDECMYEMGVWVQVLGFIATGLLLWWFGASCSLMITILSAAMAIAGVVSSVKCINEYEHGFAASHIIFSVLNVGMIVLNHLVVA